MKIIAYLVGSEVRWLVKTFPSDMRKVPYITWVKVRAWLLRPFVSEWWVDAEHLVDLVRQHNPKAKTRVVVDELKYPKSFPKEKHEGFNVLYYYPAKEYNKSYCRWVYGQDIVCCLIRWLSEVNFICVDGTQDMSKVYPIVDAYIRPNRGDGTPRIVKECEINDIPYLWTHENPQTQDFYEFIKTEYDKWKS